VFCNSGNRSSELGLADGEIWLWLSSSFWNSNEKRIMSERCARARGMLRCRGGRSGLTVAGDDLQLQWRRGGLWHEQPGSVLARVLEGDECGGGGVL
jgi:hypothetical protein